MMNINNMYVLVGGGDYIFKVVKFINNEFYVKVIEESWFLIFLFVV